MKKIRKNGLILLGLVVAVLSIIFWKYHCRTNSLQVDMLEVEEALDRAGGNRPQLERALEHFRHDRQKYDAACFLIANMPYYHSYEGELLDQYSDIYEALAAGGDPQTVLNGFISRYGHFSTRRLTKRPDVACMDASYLISNIEQAFKVWKEQPWGKNVNFRDFCEYILPYRIGEEPLQEWRSVFYEKYNPLLDSLRNTRDATDPLAAARAVIAVLSKPDKHFTTILPGLPNAGPYLCDRWRSGSCRELTDLTVYVLRALGIPCGVDFMQSHAKVNAGHSWAFILDRKGKSFISDYLDGNVISSTTAPYHTAKVYRRTFSLNRTLQARMNLLESSVPPFFRQPHFFDVTPRYFARDTLHNILVPKEKWYDDDDISSSKIVYLCVPSMRGWVPVAWDEFDGKTVRISGVKTEAVFRVAVWKDEGLVMCTNPLISKGKDGRIIFLDSNENNRENIRLFSKSNIRTEGFVKKMVGGVFEADSSIAFSHPDTLFVIPAPPERLFTGVPVNIANQYRYIRYKGPADSHCDVAEITFYAHARDTVPLTGKAISNSVPAGGDDRNRFEKAADGNPYSSYHDQHPSDCWVGLELEHPESIGRIVYTPRNRDNFIRKGDLYELFYMNWEWVSLGVQKAVSDSLIYRHVPSNALLYLKNHTRGKEERPFTYNDDKQKFW
jgi:hypothetical protein